MATIFIYKPQKLNIMSALIAFFVAATLFSLIGYIILPYTNKEEASTRKTMGVIALVVILALIILTLIFS